MATATGKRQRSCVACGRQADKVALLRIVRDPSGAVSFDATGRAPGRGAYVCSEECFAAACRKKKLDRALKATLDDDARKRIAAGVAAAAREARQ
ncbi:MAG TPA: YlxR family protein [Candidatus Rubneribacter avistercoris]|nr:YlxR family protein [Candidatus Rubneribacter avistercoris]